MATYSTEIWSERQYKRGESARRVFYVSDAANEDAAAAATGVSKGDSFHLDNRLKAGAPDVSSPKSPTQFVVAFDYALPSGGGSTEPGEDVPPRWRLIPQKSQVQVDRDRRGNPITNSARWPFDQGPARDYTDLVYEYRRYEPFLNIAVAIAYSDAVNSDSVNLPGVGTISPGQGKLDIYAQEEDTDRNQNRVMVLYRIAIRKDGWKTRIMDKGSKAAIAATSGGAITSGAITTKDGDPVSEPARLDGYGSVLDKNLKIGGQAPSFAYTSPPPGAEIEYAADGTFLKYELYEPMPFSGLLLTT